MNDRIEVARCAYDLRLKEGLPWSEIASILDLPSAGAAQSRAKRLACACFWRWPLRRRRRVGWDLAMQWRRTYLAGATVKQISIVAQVPRARVHQALRMVETPMRRRGAPNLPTEEMEQAYAMKMSGATWIDIAAALGDVRSAAAMMRGVQAYAKLLGLPWPERPSGNRGRMSMDERRRRISRYQAGASLEEIAAEAGVSRQAVEKTIKRWGVSK